MSGVEALLAEIPKKTRDVLRGFYEGLTETPPTAFYKEDGNLTIKRDKKEQNVRMPTYRPAAPSEVEDTFVARAERIAQKQAAYEQARQALRQRWRAAEGAAAGGAPGDAANSRVDLLRLNEAVRKADLLLQKEAYPYKNLFDIVGLEVRNILYDDPYNVRKIQGRVVSMNRYPMSPQELYVRRAGAGAPAGAAGAAAAAPPAATAATVPVILFSGAADENGYLSMDWPVDVQFGGTTYKSAQHALVTELAKSIGDLTAKEAFSRTDAVLVYTFEDVRRHGIISLAEEAWKENYTQLLYDTALAKFSQHPDLRDLLLATGTAALAEATTDTFRGIGLEMGSADAKTPERWMGENRVGRALERVRETLRSQFPAPAGAAGATATTAAVAASAAIPVAAAAPAGAPAAPPTAKGGKVGVVRAPITTAGEKYIVTSVSSAGLKPQGSLQVIVEKWPAANPYAKRLPDPTMPQVARKEDRIRTGTYIVSDADTTPKLVYLVAGSSPRKPSTREDSKDRQENRNANLREALYRFADDVRPASIAVPYDFGAYSDEETKSYLRILSEFSATHPAIRIRVYRPAA